MDELTPIANLFRSDKGTGDFVDPDPLLSRSIPKYPHNFTSFYDEYLNEYRNVYRRVLEIGVFLGSSVLMWDKYFPNAEIFGMDIKDSYIGKKPIRSFFGDQSKKEDLQKMIDTFGGNYDLIVDDGGHTMKQQQTTLGFMFKHLNPGGFFIVEDLHTSLFDINLDTHNNTLTLIENLSNGKKITSDYMQEDEIKYLMENCDICSIHRTPHEKPHPGREEDFSITCVIKKKREN